MDRIAQRNDALAKANRHRLAVAKKRREIHELDREAGLKALVDLLTTCEDPAILSGRLAWYLDAPKYAGPKKVAKIMRDMGIRRAECRVRDLTIRQREVIAAAVANEYRVQRRAA